MHEIVGDAWALLASGEYQALCITTNGCIKRDGANVMGAGIAKQAVARYPGIDHILGARIREHGNIFQHIRGRLFAFPTKHDWRNDSDIQLIIASAQALAARANAHPDAKYLLPRPGCNNGHLNWTAVKSSIYNILPDNVYVVTR